MSKQIQLNTIDFGGGGTTKGCDCDSGLAPIINKDTNTWLVWDNERGVYVDTGVVAGVGTEDFYASTYWVFNEIASGKKVIAKALTDRKYPTSNDESFADMADKITNMSYKEGWFAKIGYTDENASALQEMIDYSYELAKAWNPDGSTANLFSGSDIIFAPYVNVSNVSTARNFYNGCSYLVFIPSLNFENATSMEDFAYLCSNVLKIGILNTPKVTSFYRSFTACTKLKKIPYVDFASCITSNNGFSSSIVYMLIANIGQPPNAKTISLNSATSWGTNSEENRQSLIDSLITYSYDRASNGMSTATIQLSANTKALLTEGEIAQITAKGFTIA